MPVAVEPYQHHDPHYYIVSGAVLRVDEVFISMAWSVYPRPATILVDLLNAQPETSSKKQKYHCCGKKSLDGLSAAIKLLYVHAEYRGREVKGDVNKGEYCD